ncbi:MAG TPA: hypothetical protein VMW80_11410 [Candidatus Dormibacteraeota bacterium]|nr:hypothetical protein [Candidatus Dormibacteraeota bacterium]
MTMKDVAAKLRVGKGTTYALVELGQIDSIDPHRQTHPGHPVGTGRLLRSQSIRAALVDDRVQDRYAGDLGDFLKFGLLRQLCAGDDDAAALQ